jgi:hypothetical protein
MADAKIRANPMVLRPNKRFKPTAEATFCTVQFLTNCAFQDNPPVDGEYFVKKRSATKLAKQVMHIPVTQQSILDVLSDKWPTWCMQQFDPAAHLIY